ncbi:unnamed protein product, partial [Phaeothamnion confervicola]
LPSQVRAAADAGSRGDAAALLMLVTTAGQAAQVLASLLGLPAPAPSGIGAGIGTAGGTGSGSGGGLWHPLVLARRDERAVRALYDDLPLQCGQDGMRFRTQAALDRHLDALFQRNRARKEQERGGASRPWFCSREQWVTDFGAKRGGAASGAGAGGPTGGGVGGSEAAAAMASSVLADEHFQRCRLCGEPFDVFYDNDEEEWMYRNACYVEIEGSGNGGD